MPQMMPLYWLWLYLIMVISLTMLTSFLYFMHIPKPPHSTFILKFNSWTWSW